MTDPNDYPGSVTISEKRRTVTIDQADPKIRVSLEAVMFADHSMLALGRTEDGAPLLEMTGDNRSVVYAIDGFDLSTLALCCTRIDDGQTP